MCRVLIKATNGENPGRYMLGDFVVAFPDDHQFGRLETAPTFGIIDLPGVPVSDVTKYLQEWQNNGEMIERRRYTLDISKLSLNVRSDLLSTGKVSKHISEIRIAIQDKDTGEFETNKVII